ncbi:porin, partial [Comamonas sp. A23]
IDKRTMLNGYVKLGGAKIGGGYMRRKNDGYIASPRNDLWFVGVTYPIGQWTVDAQYNQLKYKDNADKGQLLVLRGTYNLSKRTAAYASLGYMKNSGNAAFGASSAQAGGTPMPGVNQTGFGMGLRHMF